MYKPKRQIPRPPGCPAGHPESIPPFAGFLEGINKLMIAIGEIVQSNQSSENLLPPPGLILSS
jgi:hypothetical protein